MRPLPLWVIFATSTAIAFVVLFPIVHCAEASREQAARKHETSVEAADRSLMHASRAKRLAFLECLDTEHDDDNTALDRCAGELE